MADQTNSRPRRVLYVLSRFPAISHTFTANEMAVVDAEGAEVFAAAIWPTLPGTVPHELEKPFLPKTQYVSVRRLATWRGALRGLARRPGVLLDILRLVPGHLKSIYLPFKLVAAIPKGLYLGDWCARHGIDHVHAHFLTSPTTVAMIAARVAGVPYSFTAHAFDITSTLPRLVNGSIPLKCQQAALAVTISEYNRRYMLEHWPGVKRAPLEVIYNGIDTDLFKPREGQQPLTGPAGEPVRILSVSRLQEKKGYDYLVRAMAVLRDRGVNARLDVYGDGPVRESLDALIKSLDLGALVTLHGAASQNEVAEQYQQADLFALACVPLPWGDADGLPTVLIEALAAELPAVSTQVTGIPEIIRDGETGRCVPTRDVDALADAIQWLIEHPDEARTMGQRGRALVLERFDRRHNAKHLLERWRTIHAARRSS